VPCPQKKWWISGEQNDDVMGCEAEREVEPGVWGCFVRGETLDGQIGQKTAGRLTTRKVHNREEPNGQKRGTEIERSK